MKYTASEIVSAAGYKPEEVLGKMRVRISGVSVNSPDHLIALPEGEQLEIIVGKESKTFDAPKRTEQSDAVNAVLRAKGAKAEEAAKARRKTKNSKQDVQPEAEVEENTTTDETPAE